MGVRVSEQEGELFVAKLNGTCRNAIPGDATAELAGRSRWIDGLAVRVMTRE